VTNFVSSISFYSSIFEGNYLVFASISSGSQVADGMAVRCERKREQRGDTGFLGAADEVLMIGSRQHQLSQLHA